eukprot:gene4389-5398_t
MSTIYLDKDMVLKECSANTLLVGQVNSAEAEKAAKQIEDGDGDGDGDENGDGKVGDQGIQPVDASALLTSPQAAPRSSEAETEDELSARLNRARARVESAAGEDNVTEQLKAKKLDMQDAVAETQNELSARLNGARARAESAAGEDNVTLKLKAKKSDVQAVVPVTENELSARLSGARARAESGSDQKRSFSKVKVQEQAAVPPMKDELSARLAGWRARAEMNGGTDGSGDRIKANKAGASESGGGESELSARLNEARARAEGECSQDAVTASLKLRKVCAESAEAVNDGQHNGDELSGKLNRMRARADAESAEDRVTTTMMPRKTAECSTKENELTLRLSRVRSRADSGAGEDCVTAGLKARKMGEQRDAGVHDELSLRLRKARERADTDGGHTNMTGQWQAKRAERLTAPPGVQDDLKTRSRGPRKQAKSKAADRESLLQAPGAEEQAAVPETENKPSAAHAGVEDGVGKDRFPEVLKAKEVEEQAVVPETQDELGATRSEPCVHGADEADKDCVTELLKSAKKPDRCALATETEEEMNARLHARAENIALVLLKAKEMAESTAAKPREQPEAPGTGVEVQGKLNSTRCRMEADLAAEIEAELLKSAKKTERLAADADHIEVADLSSPRQLQFSDVMAESASANGGLYDMSDEDEANDDTALGPIPAGPRHLDLKLLGNLIASAEPTIQDLAGKDVVILLGKTGTGKSTLVQAISGRKLRRCKHQATADGAVKDVFEADDPLEGFCIGHDQRSQTKHINHYPRPSSANSGGGARESEGEEVVVYVDSAGYQDTSGIEVDIATSISFQRVSDVCRSLRFVVLVSCVSFLEAKGGAVRDLVKLVSTLVGTREQEDFFQHRLAFTFLFTHSAMLQNLVARQAHSSAASDSPLASKEAGLPELERAQKTLHGLMVDTLRGTDVKDQTERKILHWLESCLRKGFPFVGIFHPELSDPSLLIAQVERFAPESDGNYAAIGARPGEAPRDVVRCGVTAQNAGAIALELHRLLATMKAEAKARRPEGMCEQARALVYLHRHLDLDSVRETCLKAGQLVDEAEARSREEAYRLIDAGSAADYREFGEASASSALRLVHSLRVLQSLGLGSVCEEQDAEEEALIHVYQRLTGMLAELHAALTEGPGAPKLTTSTRALCKLRAWASARPGWQHLAGDGAQALEGYIARAVAGVASSVASPCDVGATMMALQRIDAVHNHLPQLRELELNVQGVEDAWLEVTAQMKRAIQQVATEACNALRGHVHTIEEEAMDAEKDSQASSGGDRADMQTARNIVEAEGGDFCQGIDTLTRNMRTFTESVERLEALGDVLAEVEAPLELPAHARAAWRGVLAEAGDELRRRSDAIKSAVARPPPPASLEMPVRALQVLLRARTDRQQREGLGEIMWAETCEALVRMLRAQISQLAMLCDEMEEGGGLGTPQRHVTPFAVLMSHIWVDSVLDHGFVAQNLTSLKAQYDAYFKRTGVELLQALARYLEAPALHAAELETLRLKQPEMTCLSHFGSLHPSFAEAGACFGDNVARVVDRWCARQRHSLQSAFPEELAKLSSLPADAVNEVLQGAEELLMVLPHLDNVRALLEGVSERLVRCHTEISEVMQVKRNYLAKETAMKTIATWQQRALVRLTSRLPDFRGLCQSLRDEVACEAQEIRQQLMELDDWQGAEAAVEAFAAARALDTYIGHQASMDVDGLRQLLEMKRSGMDEAVQNNLKEFNFTGIRQHLEPLEGSRDKLSQLRYRTLMGVVVASVQAKIEFANAQMASATEVTKAIKALEGAEKEIGKLVERYTSASLSIADTVKRLEEGVAKTFEGLLTDLEASLAENDYPTTLTRLKGAEQYHADAANCLPNNKQSTTRIASCFKTAKDSLRVLEHQLKEYIPRIDRALTHRPDSSKLFDVLRQMKVAASDPGQPEVREFYDSAMARLGEALRVLLIQIRSKAQEHEMYSKAIEVYSDWNREWERGLKEHVPPLTDVDLAQDLDDLRQRGEQMRDRYRLYLMDQEQLINWVKLLDRLKEESSSRMSKLKQIWPLYQTEYDSQLKVLESQVSRMYTEAHTHMTKHNYILVGDQALALRRIHQMLSGHLSADLLQGCANLSLAITERFSSLCTELIATLGRGNIDEAHTVLARVHSLALSLTSDYPGIRQRAEALHQQMCEAVKDKVERLRRQLEEEFDFAGAWETVNVLRKIGHLLTGAFSLYREEFEAAFSNQGSQALGFQEIAALCSAHFGGTGLAALGMHFALLEVQPGASAQEVKKAYKRRCMATHPDRPGGSTEKQQQVERAKDVLKNKEELGRYPKELAQLFASSIRRLPKVLGDRTTKLLGDHDYEQIKAMLDGLADVHRVCELVTPPLSKESVCEPVHRAVRDQVHGLGTRVKEHWQRRELKKVHDAFGALAQMRAHLSAYREIYSDEWTNEISRSVEDEIAALAARARGFLKSESHADDNLHNVAMQLIRLGHIWDDLPEFKEVAELNLTSVLDACQAQHWGFKYIFQLGMVLERGNVGEKDAQGEVVSKDQRIGQVIVSFFKHFKDVVTMSWNEEVTQKDTGAALKELVSKRMTSGQSPDRAPDAPIDRVALQAAFDAYQDEYSTCFNMWRAGELLLDNIAHRVAEKAATLRPACHIKCWSPAVKAALPVLLGGVFAYFTILKSGDSYNRLAADSAAGGGRGNATKKQKVCKEAAPSTQNVLLKPHTIQVLTILRLLGCDTRDAALDNQLMQIRTGEGKSIILGACSILFGLLGLKVRCVCYSEYLSERDHELFRELFCAFGVSEHIVYSKITSYSEDTVAAKGNLREMTLNLIRGLPIQPQSRVPGDEAGAGADTNAKPRKASRALKRTTPQHVAPRPSAMGEILLVDEVDVFFGQDFYSKSHNQMACLAEPEVAAILKAIWALREQAARPRRLLQTAKNLPEYHTLLQKFPQWHFLLEKELEAMCYDLKDFNTPAYHYDSGRNRIGYKDMDGINYDIVWGYRTAFAYLNEHSRGTLRAPVPTLASALQLRVPCGQFSYANVAPALILGVSGTVEALGKHEWGILNRYNIQIYTRMPSVYGSSNFRFLDQSGSNPIIVEPSRDAYFQAITEEVTKMIRLGRAVLTLFPDATRLQEYVRSPYYKKVLTKNVLQESLSREEKEYVIKKAATAGQATFCTAVFGRGTDFFCKDRKLQEIGGMHVIQTFVSLEKSEELQIQGRTARQ